MKKVKIGSVALGLFVITTGILLFAFDANILPIEYKRIVFSWQMLLIAIGVICMLHKQGAGVVLACVGGFFILPKFNSTLFDFSHVSIWSALLIALGLTILWHVFFANRKHRCYCKRNRIKDVKLDANKDFSIDSSDYVNRNYIFSGSKEIIDSQKFIGGEINCIFGGLELDLSNAQLAEGVHILELNNVFGGVVLYIPIHWKVEIHKDQIFGNFEDKRPRSNFEVSENRLLIIKASSIFGGGEIKSK